MIFVDQLNHRLELKEYPRRIISLVPSLSELLWDLDLKNELAGITKFCIHPEEMYRSKIRVGGTKKTDHEIIRSLKPDLIIGNKEENTKEDIEKLRNDFSVWMSDINSLSDATFMIKELGKMTNREKEANYILNKIEFSTGPSAKPSVIYLIWNNPVMCAGKSTFIDDMISKAGFTNLITNERYPEITIEKIKKLNPDFLFLSTEPFPFNEESILKFSELLPGQKIKIVDGEMFSWYGSRLIKASEYFRVLRNDLNQ